MIYIVILGVAALVAIWLMRNRQGQPSTGTWRTSENGNLTRIVGQTRVTVYGSGRSWKYCLADATKDDNNPYFSDSYQTQEAALEEALAFLSGSPSTHVSNQETRMLRQEEALPARLASHLEKLAGFEKTLSFYQAQTNPNPDKLASFKKKLPKARSNFLRDAPDFISSDRIPLTNDQVFAYLDRFDAVISAAKQIRASSAKTDG